MKKTSSPYIRPTVWTKENDTNVNMYGYAAVYGAPPEITDEHKMQENNNNKITKISLKTSAEIKSNYLGACTTRMPRTPETEYSSMQAVNLIDGNDETCWSSKPRIRKDEYPIWIRIDLAKETKVKKVVIKKRPITFDRSAYMGSYRPSASAQEVGRAMAKHITIKTSCDAYTWETHFDGEVDRDNLEIFEFGTNGTPTKQVLVLGNDLTSCENWMYSFSIASVEVIDDNGKNVALHSKGACVTASSIHHGIANERGVAMYNWLLQMDLGFKWTRIGYHDDPINWHWVETEKGVLKMDSMAEDAIDILCENDINIIYCLNFGNRLYEGYKERHLPQLKEWYYETPYPPKSEEALNAWDNYVRFSADYFKDRVKYFEIWNEWNGVGYWGDLTDVDHYIKLCKRTIPIIRECAPDAKICLGGSMVFMHEQREDTNDEIISMFFKAIDALAPYVDAIGYHPFYQPTIDGEKFLNYADNVKWFKDYCKSKGFKGDTYMASEFAVGAMYPPTLPGTPGCWFGQGGKINFSEVQKAKILTQINLTHTALGLQSLVCELSNNEYPLELSLLRKGFDTTPILATNPNMAYYATRNASTILDAYTPSDFAFKCEGYDKMVSYAIENDSCFGILLWTTHTADDFCEGKPVDITAVVDFDVKSIKAYNFINGEVCDINFTKNANTVTIPKVLARDNPMLIEIEKYFF